MHILHNGITLGEVQLAMNRREAQDIHEILTKLLAMEKDTLHVLDIKDSTGLAVTITEPEGTAVPAERVYRFQCASGQLRE